MRKKFNMKPQNIKKHRGIQSITHQTRCTRKLHFDTLNLVIMPGTGDDIIQGVPKVIVQRFGLLAWPVAIGSTKFLRECPRKVAHLKNTLWFAKSGFIFLSERSFFTFFVPLKCLDHIPFPLLLIGKNERSSMVPI